jgi:large subunit ribosomal protein L9
MKAGETGKLYGSITSSMISEAIKKKTGIELNRRQMDLEPIRSLGTYKVHARLTIDLVPEITVIVHRENEVVELPGEAKEQAAEAATPEGEPEAAE